MVHIIDGPADVQAELESVQQALKRFGLDDPDLLQRLTELRVRKAKVPTRLPIRSRRRLMA